MGEGLPVEEVAQCAETIPYELLCSVRLRARFVEVDLLYLTGDSGRYCPDGSVEVGGRLDDQVKINGVRVEPNEAAANLAGHSALQNLFRAIEKVEEGANCSSRPPWQACRRKSCQAEDLRFQRWPRRSKRAS